MAVSPCARIYGRAIGNGSLAVVTRGFERAFKEAEIFAGLYGIDSEALAVDGEGSMEGSDARHGVFTGPLGAVGKMFEAGRHAHHWVMIAPNSDQLPKNLVLELKRYQEKHSLRFLAPSKWASGVVASFLGECTTVRHGVMPEFCPVFAEERQAGFDAGFFRVVHFSTSDRARKGTIELLQSWQHLKGYPATRDARLLCVLDYAAKLALEEALSEGAVSGWEGICSTVQLIDRVDFSAENMARLLSSAHVVCQPSRGEGFGLIPLEALCTGTPIVATAAAGHSEYLTEEDPLPGAVVVRSGPMAPIDDLPGSRAPSVNFADLAKALAIARVNWRALHAAAQKNAAPLRVTWSWEASLGPFVAQLRDA